VDGLRASLRRLAALGKVLQQMKIRLVVVALATTCGKGVNTFCSPKRDYADLLHHLQSDRKRNQP
jgi:hypothetical protein